MNVASVGIWSLIIMYFSCKTVEKNILERKEEGVFLILYYAFFSFLSLTTSSRTWRLRTDKREKPKKGLSLQTTLGAPGWSRAALRWR